MSQISKQIEEDLLQFIIEEARKDPRFKHTMAQIRKKAKQTKMIETLKKL